MRSVQIGEKSAAKKYWGSLRVVFSQAYLFNDYWEDIGTIKSFFDANLALTAQVLSPLLSVLRILNLSQLLHLWLDLCDQK